MGHVLDELCKKASLQWISVKSGQEIFVTLTRQGVLATMTPTVSPNYTRPPGTIALVHHATTGSIYQHEKLYTNYLCRFTLTFIHVVMSML